MTKLGAPFPLAPEAAPQIAWDALVPPPELPEDAPVTQRSAAPLAWDALVPPPELPETDPVAQKRSEALLGYGSGPRANVRRANPSPRVLKPLPPQFDPRKDVLWEKDGHVIDPNTVRFDVIHYDAITFHIVLRHGKEKLGQFAVRERPFGEDMCMVTSGLEPHARGRRLGALMYLIAADLVRERGQTLGSDSRQISPDAVHVWENLQRRGLAQPLNGWVNDWAIDNAALARIVGPTRAFFDARKRVTVADDA